MSYFAIGSVAALLLSGCAVARRTAHVLKPDSPKKIACIQYDFCGPYAGSYMIGSTVCYYDDGRLPDGVRKDRCE